MSAFEVRDVGRMPYSECVELQRELLEEVVAGHRANTLILVEHDPVLTLGANFHDENLLLPVEAYRERGIEVYRTDRGGDVTYHGPGQLVAYPIFSIGRDLHRWLRDLEEAVIRSLGHWGVEGYRFPPNTGVWVNGRKICAMGVKIRRWVSMHGIALNCDADLTPFSLIVPCGIQGHGVTSLTEETGSGVTVAEAKGPTVAAFEEVFRASRAMSS